MKESPHEDKVKWGMSVCLGNRTRARPSQPVALLLSRELDKVLSSRSRTVVQALPLPLFCRQRAQIHPHLSKRAIQCRWHINVILKFLRATASSLKMERGKKCVYVYIKICVYIYIYTHIAAQKEKERKNIIHLEEWNSIIEDMMLSETKQAQKTNTIWSPLHVGIKIK